MFSEGQEEIGNLGILLSKVAKIIHDKVNIDVTTFVGCYAAALA